MITESKSCYKHRHLLQCFMVFKTPQNTVTSAYGYPDGYKMCSHCGDCI